MRQVTVEHKNGASGLDGRVEGAPVVLLVEDHADTRWIMGRLLRAHGFQVVMAASVAEASGVAREQEINLLVADIGLPDGTGYDVLRHLRATQPGVRAVALSGYGMDDDVRQSLRAGFDVHLTKPVGIDRLVWALRELVA